MEYKGLEIDWFHHNCFKISGKSIKIYTDPYKVINNYNDADIILITHDHFDHLDANSISKVSSKESVIIAPKDCEKALSSFKNKKVFVSPNETKTIKGVIIKTVPSYNINKFRSGKEVFHPREKGNVGYIFIVDAIRFYIGGDTDFIEEMKTIKVDVAFLPVSGIYVMTAEEAAAAAKTIKADLTIPAHYGSGIGSKEDAERFKRLAGKELNIQILESSD